MSLWRRRRRPTPGEAVEAALHTPHREEPDMGKRKSKVAPVEGVEHVESDEQDAPVEGVEHVESDEQDAPVE